MSAIAWLRGPARVRSILLGLLVLAGVGCGKRGEVSGIVRYGGRPLPDGTVVLLASNGQAYRCSIGPDGRFTIPEVPHGKAQLAVASFVDGPHSGERARSIGTSRVGPQATTNSRIPMRYSDLTQSGLTATITANTTLDLDLK